MPTPEQDKYLQDHFNVDLAKYRTAAAAGGAASAKPASAKPTAPASRAKPAPVAKMTYESFVVLVDDLEYLADPHFRTAPPPALNNLTGEKIVGGVLHDAEQVVAKWRDAKTLPEAVRLWRDVMSRLTAMLADAQVNLQVDAAQIGEARKAINAINDFLSARAPAHALSKDEQITEMLKTEVVLAAVSALMEYYQTLLTKLHGWADKKKNTVDALKPHQTPKKGGLAFAIASTLNIAAKVAFPELMVVEVVGKGLEASEKIETIVESGEQDEDAEKEAEVNAAKKAAKDQLVDMVTGVETDQQNVQKRLTDLVNNALKGADNEIVKQLNTLAGGQSQYEKIREVLKTKFDIVRGPDRDPGVYDKIVAGLDNAFKKWLKADYQERHLPKLLTKATGGDDMMMKILARLFLIATSDDPDRDAKVKKGIADAEAWYTKSYSVGGGVPWGFQKALNEILEKEREAYEEVYAGSELHQN